jgi:hypothetical protein
MRTRLLMTLSAAFLGALGKVAVMAAIYTALGIRFGLVVFTHPVNKGGNAP